MEKKYLDVVDEAYKQGRRVVDEAYKQGRRDCLVGIALSMATGAIVGSLGIIAYICIFF